MGILVKMLKQAAVYWAPMGHDSHGQPTLDDPVQIRCRWEDTSESYVDTQGSTRISRAKIYVGQDVLPGGLLFQGTLEDVQDSGFPVNPREHQDVWEIRSFTKLPNMRATKFLRTVYI